MQNIYHIAKNKDWEEAKKLGVYDISTLNKTLADEGFIHMSFANQVKWVADTFYKEHPKLVLLKIDPKKVNSEIRVESTDSSPEKFPHLYGVLNVDAVTKVTLYEQNENGEFPSIAE